MRVLLIKTSSMGDIIHTLPALTDAGSKLPQVQFDWVVEDSFAEIPRWHSNVDKVIPISLRKWRKNIFSADTKAGLRYLRQEASSRTYDLVLDAQGLVKSAVLMLFTQGLRAGLDWGSAREPLASLFYQRRCKVNFYQHAVVRMRALFSQALGYELPDTLPDFGLNLNRIADNHTNEKYIVFLHGTTWVSKQWPEPYWIELARLAEASGYRIKISGGSDEEVARAQRLAAACKAVDAMPRLRIGEMAALLVKAKAAVAVDTGFGHLAAALNVPTVSLYGATKPAFTGAIGPASVQLAAVFPCAPCFKRTCTYRGEVRTTQPACYSDLSPARVWEAVIKLSTSITTAAQG